MRGWEVRLKKFVRYLLYHLPSKLPRSLSDFHAFADSIFDAYGIPKTDSYYHSIAVMIQHLPPTTVYKTKAWFAASIYNAQAREVAFYKIQDLQKKQREAEKSSEEKAPPKTEQSMPN